MLIIHGSNLIASRQYFLDLKRQAETSGKQPISLPAQTFSLADLITALSSLSLLGNEPAVFIEDFFSRKPGREKKNIIDHLLNKPDLDLWFWEGKDQTLLLKNFPPQTVTRFDLPKYIFQFLDHPTLDSLKPALAAAAPEQLLSLLAHRFHQLLLVSYGQGSFPPWQQNRLQKQAAKYSQEKLVQLHLQLLKLDYSQKTSSAPNDLAAALELWVLGL